MKWMLTAFTLFISCIGAAQMPKEKIDSLLQTNAYAFSGKRSTGVYAEIREKGKTQYQQGFQGFDAEKVVPIASASKWLAALVVMRLTDRKVIRLTDPVSKYLKAFDTDDKRAITLGQCFSHTSGLPGNQQEDESETAAGFAYNKGSLLTQANEIAKLPLQATPGTRFYYGGLSMQVVGAVCEQATGKSWNALFAQEVTGPLEMAHTKYFGEQMGRSPRIAGGILSNATDYLKVLQMLGSGGKINGKQYLSTEAMEQLFQAQPGSNAVGYSPFSKYKSLHHPVQTPMYAIGCWKLEVNGTQIYTSPGAFGFTPWISMKTKQYGVLATQSSGPKVMPVWLQLVSVILPAQRLSSPL